MTLVRSSLPLAAVAAVPALLSGCEAGVAAPREPGACWHMVTKDGETRFNRVGASQPDLEHCAARLERMRRSFLSLGSERSEVIGAYQGRFIFLERSGIKTGKSLTGNRYMALVRTNDGRLVTPGALRRVSE